MYVCLMNWEEIVDLSGVSDFFFGDFWDGDKDCQSLVGGESWEVLYLGVGSSYFFCGVDQRRGDFIVF